MWKYLNRGVPTPIAITIILIFTIVLGAIDYWEYVQIQRIKREIIEIEVPKKEEAPKEETPEEVMEEEPEEKEASEEQAREVQVLMEEINSILSELTGLNDSINELDENQDLFKIFQGN